MFPVNEQLSKLSANGFEQALRLAQISLDSAERLVRLQLEASKQALEENVQLARELAGVKDPAAAFGQINKLASLSVEKAVGHSRGVYDIVSRAQGEFGRLAEDSFGVLNKSLQTGLDSFGANAPAGSDVALNAFKSSLAAAAATVSSLGKAAQQVAEFADTSVKAASSATADAVKTAGRKSSAAV